MAKIEHNIAKLPHDRDMDTGNNGQFMQHWQKRHLDSGSYLTTHERFPDDSVPLWWAVRLLHRKIHAGQASTPVPTDHIHLPPLDPQIQIDLEELI